MTLYVVRQGECFSSIAERHGFRDYKTIYDHPDNAELKKKRPDPNLLHPGDEIRIPELSIKEVSAVTAKEHRFEIHAPQKVLRLKLVLHGDEPLANESYRLVVDRVVHEGATNGNGEIEIPVDIASRRGELEIAGRKLMLHLSALNPIDETDDEGVTGIQSRLANLGFDVGPIDGRLGPRTHMAIALFQAEEKLEIDGELTDATRKKLAERHGC